MLASRSEEPDPKGRAEGVDPKGGAEGVDPKGGAEGVETHERRRFTPRRDRAALSSEPVFMGSGPPLRGDRNGPLPAQSKNVLRHANGC
jgi:hypothetical protein